MNSFILLQSIVGTYGPFVETLGNIYTNFISNDQGNALIRYAQLIAGIGTLFYISYRVWKQLANGEPIAIFSLLRPFTIGLCIASFSLILYFINGILSPLIRITEALSANDIRFSTDCSMGWSIGSAITCGFEKLIAGLLDGIIWLIRGFLNIYRVLALIILAAIGPLAFGLSIFDGFQNSLTSWITRYVNIYLWLPIANILHFISYQVYVQLNAGGYYFWTRAAFVVVIIYIYTKIPEITSWIISPGIEESGGIMGGGAIGGARGVLSGAKKGGGAAGGYLLKKMRGGKKE